MASIDASLGTQVLRCSSVPKLSTIHAHMLWMDRNAARVGSAAASASKMRTASSRRSLAAARVLTAVDGAHAEFGRRAQHVGGEVMGLIPFQRVRRDALLGERGRRLGDHAFVFVQVVQIHRCTTSWSG